MIALKNPCHLLIQSEVEPKPIVTCLQTFSCALCWLHVNYIGHFWVTLCLCFTTSLCAKPFMIIWKCILIQIKFFFMWMVSQVHSFWNRGKEKRQNGLLHVFLVSALARPARFCMWSCVTNISILTNMAHDLMGRVLALGPFCMDLTVHNLWFQNLRLIFSECCSCTWFQKLTVDSHTLKLIFL